MRRERERETQKCLRYIVVLPVGSTVFRLFFSLCSGAEVSRPIDESKWIPKKSQDQLYRPIQTEDLLAIA